MGDEGLDGSGVCFQRDTSLWATADESLHALPTGERMGRVRGLFFVNSLWYSFRHGEHPSDSSWSRASPRRGAIHVPRSGFRGHAAIGAWECCSAAAAFPGPLRATAFSPSGESLRSRCCSSRRTAPAGPGGHAAVSPGFGRGGHPALAVGGCGDAGHGGACRGGLAGRRGSRVAPRGPRASILWRNAPADAIGACRGGLCSRVRRRPGGGLLRAAARVAQPACDRGQHHGVRSARDGVLPTRAFRRGSEVWGHHERGAPGVPHRAQRACATSVPLMRD